MSTQQRNPWPPQVIAHRGETGSFPENTLPALEAAVTGGVRFVEFDVQLSADRVPVLSHDASLLRTAGVDRLVTATIAAELNQVSVGEPHRLGKAFGDVCMPRLQEVVEAMGSRPGLTLFVELKRHSLRAFGRQRVLDAVLPLVDACADHVVLISFDRPVLERVRNCRVGWVLDEYSDATLQRLEHWQPDFLFCNHRRLPATGQLWPGPWQWAVYEVTDVVLARQLWLRGADLVESLQPLSLQSALADS